MHTSTLHISPSRAFLETTPSSTNLNQLKDAKYNSGTPLFSAESNIPLYTRLHTRVYVKLRSWTVSLEAEHGTVSSRYRSISHGTHFTWPRSTRRCRSKHALPRFTGDLSINRGIPRRYLDAWQARVQPLGCIFVRGGKGTRGRPATVLQLCSWGYLSRLVSTAHNRVVT